MTFFVKNFEALVISSCVVLSLLSPRLNLMPGSVPSQHLPKLKLFLNRIWLLVRLLMLSVPPAMVRKAKATRP